MKFTNREIKDLLIAWLAISLAFSILFSGATFIPFSKFIIITWISALTAGIGFLFHEIMHKFTAQRYGYWAEFHASYPMLIIAILLSFAGFIIAAPGAVMIHARMISKEKNGKISLAGPATNIVLSIIFLFLLLFTSSGIFLLLFKTGLTINSLLAVFNLLPFGFFDGKKIYEWNKPVYLITIAAAAILFISSSLAASFASS